MQISFDVYLSCALMRYTSPHDISEKMLKTNNAVLVSTYLDVEKGMKVRFTSKPGRSDNTCHANFRDKCFPTNCNLCPDDK